MVDAHNNQAEDADKPRVAASVDCKSDIVYLKEDFNFAGGDKVTFYYSFDGSTWTQLGDPMQLSYELKHFMGSKFAIFNYATKSTGGYADFDYFRVTDKLTGTDAPEAKDHAASLSGTDEINGVINSEATVKVTMDELTGEGHTDLKASLSIPSGMDVKDVTFNSDAINGETSWNFKNGHLVLQAAGKDLTFKAADKLFATVTLKMTGYADKDTTVNVSADYITADKGTVEYDVKACSLDIKEKYLDPKALAKKLGYSNPLVTTDFGADPYAIVYDGRVYVYMTSDDYEYDAKGNVLNNSFGYIKTLRIISSDDMVNWTDHGEIKVAGNDGAAKWASNSWAPAIAYKQIDGKDKFFLYFANDASGIGVLEADTPLGPWKDPIGKALLTKETPGCKGVEWCFDPAVLVDDDGSAYIYFGGGVPNGQQNNPKTARVAKLGEDMISIDGEAKEIDAPCMFEDSGIFKYGDKYYYSYCSNFMSPHKEGYPGYGTICYMVSDNPMGPFKYAGEVFENPQIWFGVGGNNHHATFVYEGKSYFIYHAQTLSKAQEEAQGLAPGTLTKGYRSTHIDPIELNSDGTIRPIAGTYEGISQLKTINPYERIDAETVAWNAGIKIADCAEEGKLFKDFNRQITDLQDGDWTSVAQAAFGDRGAAEFTVKAASKSGGQIEIHMDSPEGALVGTVNVEATGSENTFKEFSCKLDRITDTHNVFLVFKGKAENLMNVDYYSFGEYQVNTEALSSKIAEAERLLSSLTGSAKTDLEKAIAEAKALLEKADADQGEIDNAFDSLSKAYNTAKATISDGGKKDDDTKKPDGSTKKPTNGGTDGNTQTPSKDSMQIHGPMPSRISSGRHPYPAFIFSIIFPTIFPALPRHPPWASPMTPCTGSLKRRGVQSANSKVSGIPDTLVISPSVSGMAPFAESPPRPAMDSSTMAIWVPCTCTAPTARSGRHPSAVITRIRFSFTCASSSPRKKLMLRFSYIPLLTPPRRVVTTPRTVGPKIENSYQETPFFQFVSCLISFPEQYIFGYWGMKFHFLPCFRMNKAYHLCMQCLPVNPCICCSI